MKRWLRPLLLVLLLALAIIAPLGQGNYIVYTLTSWLIFSIAAMGLNLTLGYAGQISLAQASFMAIGAYTTALLTLAGWHWVLAMPLGLILCFAVGLLLGYPALRVKGHFLAFVTLAFNTLVFLILRNEEWLTGGSYGLVGMPRPDFGLFSTMKQLPFYYFTLGITVIASLVMWGIVRSPWGRAFKALRENPVRAESLGVDTRRITLLAFAIGSVYGGLAGALITPLVQFIEPGSFGVGHSLRILLMVVVGGAGYFFGPFLGAGVVIMLPEMLRFTAGYYLIIYSALVIVMLVFVPSGLIGIGGRLREKFRPRREVRADMREGARLQ
ncbi:amino acid/amide ABC transporter membrane protein 2 (HAAT family) [Pseudaminobacter salicylatoxidans]|uniref:Amino acid/amide ABC transporter membrane protein 2 (HAAT family) n=1 Tax=Pseudaminobacter salicylatoxidans TaxID=93369 RepID=A0A316C8V7_PSESE|nr:branched-chain amino acid ABC transporter permease [Pseudaminobacter salicylatoxidans]PWJ86232.1 amino acid/amide ABC transporter membrane protein 2 (HAAT family) [Pseudaminobacter salicylatoxidans]